jgi:hypothetical protein
MYTFRPEEGQNVSADMVVGALRARPSRAPSRALRVVGAGFALALLLAACGDDSSPEDEARSDGVAVGEAIAGLGEITVDNAAGGDAVAEQLEAIEAATDELLADRADTIGSQVEDVQGIVTETVDAVAKAVEGGNFGDASDALEAGVTELETTITGFAGSNDSVSQAAWEGVESGLESGSD